MIKIKINGVNYPLNRSPYNSYNKLCKEMGLPIREVLIELDKIQRKSGYANYPYDNIHKAFNIVGKRYIKTTDWNELWSNQRFLNSGKAPTRLQYILSTTKKKLLSKKKAPTKRKNIQTKIFIFL